MDYKEQVEELIKRGENGDDVLIDSFIELRQIKSDLDYLLNLIKDFEYKYLDEISQQANEYPNGYRGFDIKKVNGRVSYSFKNIKEWSDAEKAKKDAEAKYKSLFLTFQKTNERPMSEDGVIYDLPEVNYSKSYLKITEKK